MRRIVYLLPLLVLGCANPPSSLVPLTGDAASALEGRIVGEWRLASAKPKQKRRPIISFGTLDDIVATISAETASHYRLTLQREDSVVSVTGTLSRIDDSFYIDLQHPPIQDAAIAGTTLRPHYFAKCIFVDNQIRLTGCDGARFKEVLQADRLPFVEVDSALVFTGTSDQLHDVIRDNCADLFPMGTGDVILTPRKPEGSDHINGLNSGNESERN